MKIRVMKTDDYGDVSRLWKDIDGIGLRSLDDSYAGIEKFLKRNPATCFVAEDDSRLIGVILSGHDGRRGYIYHAAVASDYRSRGIGTALVEHVVEAMKQEGINKLALVAFADNLSGNLFWEKHGFVLRGDLNYRNLSINKNNN